MSFYYEKISEGRVESEILQQANIALDFCKRDLRLSNDIYIQWTRPASKEDFDKNPDRYGEALQEFYGSMIAGTLSSNKNRILIRADIPLDEILHTLAHECQHIAGRDIRGEYSITGHLSRLESSRHPSEIRANAYADRVMPKIQESIDMLKMLEETNKNLRAINRVLG